MWNEIAAWQETLAHRPDLSAKTIALYTQDARRFATWLQSEHPGLKATEVTPIDAKTYRDHLLAKRFAPTTINRALISLMLFFDTIDGTNPFRTVTMIEIVEPAPVALSKTEWNAVRRCAEQVARRDHGLAFALAVKYSPAGGEIVLRSQSKQDTIQISTQDQGIGIPEEAQKDIFVPYSRIASEHTRYIGGTGLGLSVVYEIIRLHRGTIWVESTREHGSTFHVSLPTSEKTLRHLP